MYYAETVSNLSNSSGKCHGKRKDARSDRILHLRFRKLGIVVSSTNMITISPNSVKAKCYLLNLEMWFLLCVFLRQFSLVIHNDNTQDMFNVYGRQYYILHIRLQYYTKQMECPSESMLEKRICCCILMENSLLAWNWNYGRGRLGLLLLILRASTYLLQPFIIMSWSLMHFFG